MLEGTTGAFSVYALFLFILTAFVAAAPAGSSLGNSGATEVGETRLENSAGYVSGGIWTRQSTPSVSRLCCRMVHLYLTHLTGRSARNYAHLHKQQYLNT
ncbi:hypothetical protein F5887DRAFT_988202 [Amanita rubescens]|nr:hypothetical protein F5887DRAFT_988202 [Amanita rubescens]